VAGAPGPRREPGTFRTAVKGPDHYPSWEVVANNATLMDVYMPQEFADFLPPHGSPQQRPGATDQLQWEDFT
jgi:hypothetical protein